MPKLMIDEGGQASVFELFEDEISVGRGASNAIQVVDGHASKNHAVIRLIGGRAKLVDLESKNGTKVNGEFRNQRWLEHGDSVSIGAAVLTFDGSDVGPAAPSVRGAVSARAPAPRAAGPVSVAAELTSAPPPMRTASRRSRQRDEDDGDGDGPRVVARRGGNSALVGLAVGGGVLAVIALLFLLLSNMGGTGSNAQALRRAKEISAQGKNQEALDFLRANGDPGAEDTYKSVQIEIDYLKKILASAGDADRGKESEKVYQLLERDWIEKYKNKFSDDAWRARLKDFVTKYKGTTKVMEFLGASYGFYPKMREFIGEQ